MASTRKRLEDVGFSMYAFECREFKPFGERISSCRGMARWVRVATSSKGHGWRAWTSQIWQVR